MPVRSTNARNYLFIDCRSLFCNLSVSFPIAQIALEPIDLLGPVLGRMDFSRIFIFGPPDFFADFLPGSFSPHFCGKKCPEKSSRKILQNLYNKNPRHISAEGPGQDLWIFLQRLARSLIRARIKLIRACASLCN